MSTSNKIEIYKYNHDIINLYNMVVAWRRRAGNFFDLWWHRTVWLYGFMHDSHLLKRSEPPRLMQEF